MDTVVLAPGVQLEDDWFALKPLDEDTLAIGEPAYHQCNWSYLISDADESLLWDTGSGRRAIAPLVARHGRANVTAFPSHMHYDHLGGIGAFGPVMMADLSMLRALEVDGMITPIEDVFLGSHEGLPAPTFPIGRWIKPGAHIAVGKRLLEVLHTPGHSPDSVSLWEVARNRLYAADLVYPGELYAQTPGASLRAYRDTLAMLLERMPLDVEIVCAHGCDENGCNDMPVLGYGDLEEVLRSLKALLGTRPHAGELQVNERMALIYSAESFAD